ncbi:bactofilin family protein [Desulfotalea psychrophila]|uniref:Polymer-forming cytoskeletal protein n=1 Tax=Desulfotalea psychrophila (strain LSv54 / DSM 12343) TaxID=177439 RepID=Q6APJ7_DESPS|nr:polymer-forming cytoskeletal protein [Desulfotalea psychrophila]CAG35727.1 hypothetical protein DP0998 [Desulfotalea psychrophila LSv54]
MFGKSTNVESTLKKIDGEAIASIIDKSMTITGEISFKGKTRIDGTVIGNIRGEHLILSESGKIEGNLQLDSFNCFGSLLGNIKTGLLTARKDCCIVGTIESTSLTVEPGAGIEGEVKAALKKQVAPPLPEKKK